MSKIYSVKVGQYRDPFADTVNTNAATESSSVWSDEDFSLDDAFCPIEEVEAALRRMENESGNILDHIESNSKEYKFDVSIYEDAFHLTRTPVPDTCFIFPCRTKAEADRLYKKIRDKIDQCDAWNLPFN